MPMMGTLAFSRKQDICPSSVAAPWGGKGYKEKKMRKKPKTTQSSEAAVVQEGSGDAKLYNQFFFGVDTDL